jgi:hypothetical protein
MNFLPHNLINPGPLAFEVTREGLSWLFSSEVQVVYLSSFFPPRLSLVPDTCTVEISG